MVILKKAMEISMLVTTDESKGTLKTYEELWKITRDLIRSMFYNSDNYLLDLSFMRNSNIKFFLDECFYKL